MHSTFFLYFLLCRLLDINIDNEIERIHAMRLVKKMMQVNAAKLPQSLVSVLVSIANNGVEEKDKLHKIALSLLCELGMNVLAYTGFSLLSMTVSLSQ